MERPTALRNWDVSRPQGTPNIRDTPPGAVLTTRVTGTWRKLGTCPASALRNTADTPSSTSKPPHGPSRNTSCEAVEPVHSLA